MKFDMDSSFGYLINRLSIANKNSFNKLIKPYGVSPEQWTVLFRVVEKNGITQKELSDSTYKDQGNLTRMIDKLVERGYLLRDSDENDRRSVKLFATHSSKQLVQKIAPLSTQQNEKLSSTFSEEEKEKFIELLNKAYLNV
ncbi:MarR family winged helix-turn-helix transcriptional regulator [Sulfurimonas sp.]|uniref:MarR family winged helix-turn-helix transcriptional regulator n=1 Tax=Sulfurimonas sp. TaxID=2022749 RepID=UPI0035684EDE